MLQVISHIHPLWLVKCIANATCLASLAQARTRPTPFPHWDAGSHMHDQARPGLADFSWGENLGNAAWNWEVQRAEGRRYHNLPLVQWREAPWCSLWRWYVTLISTSQRRRPSRHVVLRPPCAAYFQLEWMNGMGEWNGWMEWMNEMGEWNGWMKWMNGMNEWNGWMEWMNGMNEWNQWMECMNGMHEWNAWMEWMNEMNEWNEWMEWMNGMNEWNEWVEWMSGMNEWDEWVEWKMEWMNGMNEWNEWVEWNSGRNEWKEWVEENC